MSRYFTMTKKFHISLLIVTLGFFLMPTLTFACGTNAEKSCRGVSSGKKRPSAKTQKKDCCKKGTCTAHHHSKGKNHDGCDGNCNDSSCHCSPTHFSVTLPSSVEMKPKYFHFFTEKQTFYDKETYLSSGFCSVWLPPKIS